MKRLNLMEAAAFIGVKRVKMLQLANSGAVSGAKISKAWMFTEEHLESYMRREIERQTQARRKPPGPDPLLPRKGRRRCAPPSLNLDPG